jgi:hypothetical protein
MSRFLYGGHYVDELSRNTSKCNTRRWHQNLRQNRNYKPLPAYFFLCDGTDFDVFFSKMVFFLRHGVFIEFEKVEG